MCYIISMNNHAQGDKRGGDSPPFALGAMGEGGAHRGGGSPPCRGLRQRPSENFWSLFSNGKTHPWFCAWVCTWFWGMMVFSPWYFVDPVNGTMVMF